MKDVRILSIPEIKQLLATESGVTLKATNKAEAYAWIARVLRAHRYDRLTKPERGLIARYIRTMTGYSPAQTKRLIGRWVRKAKLTVTPYKRHQFVSIYTRDDTILLAHVDEVHDVLSGPATRQIMAREFVVYGKPAYERLAGISVSHIYNLRHSFLYHQHVAVFTKTSGPKSTLGIRRRPTPNGKPGYIRIDSVHQGDLPMDERTPHHGGAADVSAKGVYHINFVDEVTQWELIACVATIGSRDLLPVIEAILIQFPFIVIEFHADNGSEYINRLVVKLLNTLLIDLTKSRPRRHNDNALVETKNGGIIRKAMGYRHISSHYAGLINTWYDDWFNTYLNYHRPCGFATTTVDHKGKEKKVYRPSDYMTPYRKLRSLPDAAQYLKPGITFAQLDRIEHAMSDTDYAEKMSQAKDAMLSELERLERLERQTRVAVAEEVPTM